MHGRDRCALKEVKKPSVIPVYGIAAVFLVYNLLFPMYKLWHLLLCTALAAAAYAVLRKVCPPEVTWVKEPEPEPDTGNAELDAAIRQGRAAAAEIRALDEAIPDAALSASLASIASLVDAIFAQVEKEPDKLPKIRRMMAYYLPTTLKLVRKYKELQNEAALPNVNTMLGEIAAAVKTVEGALRRQLDSLYEHDVVDITADIQVLERILESQGLTGESVFEVEKEK